MNNLVSDFVQKLMIDYDLDLPRLPRDLRSEAALLQRMCQARCWGKIFPVGLLTSSMKLWDVTKNRFLYLYIYRCISGQ